MRVPKRDGLRAQGEPYLCTCGCGSVDVSFGSHGWVSNRPIAIAVLARAQNGETSAIRRAILQFFGDGPPALNSLIAIRDGSACEASMPAVAVVL